MKSPKYRVLTSEELQALEKEFVDFLVVNGITAPDWQEMKEKQKAEAEQMMVLFSDVVFEGIMRKTQFLEYWEPSGIKTFHCQQNEIVLVGVEAKPGTAFDFMKMPLQEIFQNSAALSVYDSRKPYSKVRELEVFEMMQQGCQRTNGDLYKKFCLLLVN
ncbi:MAG: DUF6495 family protein [Cytophagales bacterium]|nr:DUF6495 family protein [Cytophagales bacterium]